MAGGGGSMRFDLKVTGDCGYAADRMLCLVMALALAWNANAAQGSEKWCRSMGIGYGPGYHANGCPWCNCAPDGNSPTYYGGEYSGYPGAMGPVGVPGWYPAEEMQMIPGARIIEDVPAEASPQPMPSHPPIIKSRLWQPERRSRQDDFSSRNRPGRSKSFMGYGPTGVAASNASQLERPVFAGGPIGYGSAVGRSRMNLPAGDRSRSVEKVAVSPANTKGLFQPELVRQANPRDRLVTARGPYLVSPLRGPCDDEFDQEENVQELEPIREDDAADISE